MARELTGASNLNLNTAYTNTQQTDAQSLKDPVVAQDVTIEQVWANGTSIDQVNRQWQSKSRTLASAADEDIDVYDFDTIDIGAGAGLDQFGQALTLTGIKQIIVVNKKIDSGGVLTIGGSTTSAAANWNSPFAGSDTASISLEQGGRLDLTAPTAAGFAVANTTNHMLGMAASGGNVEYDIYILAID